MTAVDAPESISKRLSAFLVGKETLQETQLAVHQIGWDLVATSENTLAFQRPDCITILVAVTADTITVTQGMGHTLFTGVPAPLVSLHLVALLIARSAPASEGAERR